MPVPEAIQRRPGQFSGQGQAPELSGSVDSPDEGDLLYRLLLHPMMAALLPSLITGAFLAYCYAHFASRSAGQAVLATTAFHGAINVVGWTMIVLG